MRLCLCTRRIRTSNIDPSDGCFFFCLFASSLLSLCELRSALGCRCVPLLSNVWFYDFCFLGLTAFSHNLAGFGAMHTFICGWKFFGRCSVLPSPPPLHKKQLEEHMMPHWMYFWRWWYTYVQEPCVCMLYDVVLFLFLVFSLFYFNCLVTSKNFPFQPTGATMYTRSLLFAFIFVTFMRCFTCVRKAGCHTVKTCVRCNWRLVKSFQDSFN